MAETALIVDLETQINQHYIIPTCDTMCQIVN